MNLQKTSILDLLIRKTLLEKLIRESVDDPRVEEPKRQLALIEAELKSRKDVNKSPNNEDEEGNLTVGLRPIKMSASNKIT